MAFKSDPTLFAQAQSYVNKISDAFINQNSTITECKSFPTDYDYESEVNDIISTIIQNKNNFGPIKRNISNMKDKLLSLDSNWGAVYYQTMSTFAAQINGNLSPELQASYTESYLNTLLYLLNEKEKNGSLTQEEINLRNQINGIFEQMETNKEQAIHKSYLIQTYSDLHIDSREYYEIMGNSEKMAEYREYCDLMKKFYDEKEQSEGLTEDEKKLRHLYDLEIAYMDGLEMNKTYSVYSESPESLYARGVIDDHEFELMKQNQNGISSYNVAQEDTLEERKRIAEELGLKKKGLITLAGEALTDLGKEWKEGFDALGRGEGVGELLDATVKTGATVVEGATAVGSGALKLLEWVDDGVNFVGGGIASGLTWVAVDSWNGSNYSGQIMDSTLDDIRRDKTGEFVDALYNNDLGRWIDSQAAFTHDSELALGIRDTSEFGFKAVSATAATVATGGAAAPLVIGGMYGAGKASEKYAQSVNRENGEGYDYGKVALQATAGGVAGAVEWYNLGQAGAAAYNGLSRYLGASSAGNGVSSVEAISETLAAGKPNVVKSFVKNMVTEDFAIDTAGTVLSHATNLAAGNETWDEALKGTGADLIWVLGGHGIGAIAGTAAEVKQYKNAMAEADNLFRSNMSSLSDFERKEILELYGKHGDLFDSSNYNSVKYAQALDAGDIESMNKYFSGLSDAEKYAIRSADMAAFDELDDFMAKKAPMESLDLSSTSNRNARISSYEIEQDTAVKNRASEYDKIKNELDEIYSGRKTVGVTQGHIDSLENRLRQLREEDLKSALKGTDWDVGKVEFVDHTNSLDSVSKRYERKVIENIENAKYGDRFTSMEKEVYIREKLAEIHPEVKNMTPQEYRKLYFDDYKKVSEDLYIKRVVDENVDWNVSQRVKSEAIEQYELEHGTGSYKKLSKVDQDAIVQRFKSNNPDAISLIQMEETELLREKAHKIITEVDNSVSNGVYKTGEDSISVLNMIEDNVRQETIHSATSLERFNQALGASDPNENVRVYLIQGVNDNGAAKFGGSIGRPNEGAFVMTEESWIKLKNNREIFDESGKLINREKLSRELGGVMFSSDDVYLLSVELKRGEVEMAKGSLQGSFLGDWVPNAKNPAGYEAFIKPDNVFDSSHKIGVKSLSQLSDDEVLRIMDVRSKNADTIYSELTSKNKMFPEEDLKLDDIKTVFKKDGSVLTKEDAIKMTLLESFGNDPSEFDLSLEQLYKKYSLSDTPIPSSLSTKEARVWYLYQETLSNDALSDFVSKNPSATLKDQAEFMFDHRNQLREISRASMSDKLVADYLDEVEVHSSFDDFLKYKKGKILKDLGESGKNLSPEELEKMALNDIINSATKSRNTLNLMLGIGG